MSSNPRLVAYKALRKVFEDNGYSNIVFNNQVKESSLSSMDVSLAAAIFYGVLERKLTLDYVIGLYSTVKLKKISSNVIQALRIGTYQILFMDKIPDSAAVNESVKLIKAPKNVRGFANAVLRTVVRNKDKIRYGSKSILYSCPEWLVDFFAESYGNDVTEVILKSFLEKPDLVIRVNTLKTTKQNLIERLQSKKIKADVVFDSLDALKLQNTNSIEQLSEFKEGLFHVQDIASQICCGVLDPVPGEIVADVCSAPGGKTFTLAQMMRDKGKILASDLYESKMNLVLSGTERLGISIVETFVNDWSVSCIGEGFADKVMCDVPCSGLGIIRRRPEIRYKEHNWFEGLPDIQLKILENASKMLKVNGKLVYSTCTLNPKENSGVLEKFLSRNKDFVACNIKLPEGVRRTINEPDNQITLIPGVNNSDGFFISCIKRLR